MFLNALAAVYQFYVLLMVPVLVMLFYGLQCWYRGYKSMHENLIRRGKMLTMFGIVAMVSICIVSLLITGSIPK